MRVTNSANRKARKYKILEHSKGFRGRSKNNYTIAFNLVLKKFKKQFIGRKEKKRDMKSLWITRINAAARMMGSKYSVLFPKLHEKFNLNRKMISELAIRDYNSFKELCSQVL